MTERASTGHYAPTAAASQSDHTPSSPPFTVQHGVVLTVFTIAPSLPQPSTLGPFITQKSPLRVSSHCPFPPSSARSGHPPVCSVSQDSLFRTFHGRGLMQYAALGVWFLPLSVAFSRLVRVWPVSALHSLLLGPSDTPRACAQALLSIRPSVAGREGCLHLSATPNPLL